MSVLGEYMALDDYLNSYARQFAEDTVRTTTEHSSDAWYTSSDRAMYVAENESNTSFNYSEYRQAIEQGKTQKQWITMRDKRVRHTHAEVDGEVVGIDDIFLVGNSMMLFPKDDSLGASAKEIINCRCSVKYFGDSGISRKTESDVNAAVSESVPISRGNEKLKSVNQSRSRFTRDAENDIMPERNMAMGLRKPASHVLTEEEIESIKEDAIALEINISLLMFNAKGRTGFVDAEERINVCGDVLPDLDSTVARDRMSQRAVLAHEYYGHMANHPSEYEMGDWRDEFRASYDAAINAPNLTDEDRALLMVDAYDRAREAGEFQGYDEIARKMIYGY